MIHTFATAIALMAEKKPMNIGACAMPPSMAVKGLTLCLAHTADSRFWYSCVAVGLPLCMHR